MALQATVTKKAVKLAQENMHIITFNLVVMDGAAEVINQDVSIEYRKGDAPAGKVADVKEKFQKMIDDYKAEQQIFNANALNTAVSNIQGGLIL